MIQLIKRNNCPRKIHNSIDKDTLVIVGKQDIYAPLNMYREYDISNFIALDNHDHSIVHTITPLIEKRIETFLLTHL